MKDIPILIKSNKNLLSIILKLKIMSKKIILVFTLALVLPVIAFAQEGAKIQATIFSENIEKIIELVNLVIALFAGVYAVKLAALSQGGSMEKTWNRLAIVAVLFVLLEITGALKGFELVHISGLAEIVEFVFVIVFAYCLYSTRKELLKKMLGK